MGYLKLNASPIQIDESSIFIDFFALTKSGWERSCLADGPSKSKCDLIAIVDVGLPLKYPGTIQDPGTRFQRP